MAVFAYSNRALGLGAFTAVTGTWATNPPIANLGTLQVPTPHAEVTPDAGEIEFSFESQDAAGDPEDMTVDVLALLSTTLPSGAVVEFLNGSTSLATTTYTPDQDQAGPGHVIAVLSSPVTLSTLSVNITVAGSAAVNIGGLWASTSWRRSIALAEFQTASSAFDSTVHVDATPWPNRRASIETIQARWPALSEAEAIGPDAINWRDLARRIGYSSPVVLIPIARRPQDATYGLITGYEPTTPHRRGLWRGGFTLQGIV